MWRKRLSAIWRKRKSFRSDLSDYQTVSRRRDDAVLIVGHNAACSRSPFGFCTSAAKPKARYCATQR
jgi:hypothetical protein